jgi:hypothetical protein
MSFSTIRQFGIVYLCRYVCFFLRLLAMAQRGDGVKIG